MPTYQYACTDPDCDHRFEQFQSFTDAALTECPVCASRLRKVYGSVGVVFKGSGFYRNDSRAETNGAKDDKKKTSDADSGSVAESSSSSGSSDSSDNQTKSDGAGARKDKDAAGKQSPSPSTAQSSASSKAPAKSGPSSSRSAGGSRS